MTRRIKPAPRPRYQQTYPETLADLLPKNGST
ncbi:hypothetical protein HNQ07_004128 [Deinococcus metalli]|uniref:Uncharacterized protein n=1 Tax=Deinococcus metalli TaxID=1141878 RepID=A0A7W8NR65_9DEIO|nr:hypothetical protein [Deinococcus metalli]